MINASADNFASSHSFFPDSYRLVRLRQLAQRCRCRRFPLWRRSAGHRQCAALAFDVSVDPLLFARSRHGRSWCFASAIGSAVSRARRCGRIDARLNNGRQSRIRHRLRNLDLVAQDVCRFLSATPFIHARQACRLPRQLEDQVDPHDGNLAHLERRSSACSFFRSLVYASLARHPARHSFGELIRLLLARSG